MLLSPAMLGEILDVLHRSELLTRFPQMAAPPELDRVVRLLEQAEVLEPATRLQVCRDPNDDKLFECAVEGRADCIVSEDRDVLDMVEFQGIALIDTPSFIERVTLGQQY